FDAVHTPILVTERSGAIVRVNDAALALSGLSTDSIAGRMIGGLGTGEPWQTAAQLVSYIAGEGSGTASETKDASGRTWNVTIERGSIAEVIDDAVRGRRAAARAAHVALKNATNGEAVPMMLMDRSRLRQVFDNLIDNGIQHSQRGGEVAISHAFVEHAGRSWVEYRAEDSGDGFAQQALEL